MVSVKHPARGWAALVVAASLAGPSCRRSEASSTPLGVVHEVQERRPIVEAPPARRAPDTVVVTVDGEAIREADVVVGAAFHQGVDRAAVVQELIEERLLAHHAESFDVSVTERELDDALERIADQNQLTLQRLREAVADTAISWEAYRARIMSQLREAKLLRLLFFSLDPMRLDDGSGGGPLKRQLAEHRARLVGCLRARAEVVVADPTVQLPDNPYASEGSIAHLKFSESSGLPAAALEAAALAAAAGQSLCDAIPAAIAALERDLVELGYLEARASIRWPDAVSSAMVIDVALSPGPIHRVGAVKFDQSSLPKARRLRRAELGRRVRDHLRSGEVAKMKAIRAASQAVSELSAAAALEGTMLIDRQVEESIVRLDLTIRICERVNRWTGECKR